MVGRFTLAGSSLRGELGCSSSKGSRPPCSQGGLTLTPAQLCRCAGQIGAHDHQSAAWAMLRGRVCAGVRGGIQSGAELLHRLRQPVPWHGTGQEHDLGRFDPQRLNVRRRVLADKCDFRHTRQLAITRPSIRICLFGMWLDFVFIFAQSRDDAFIIRILRS